MNGQDRRSCGIKVARTMHRKQNQRSLKTIHFSIPYMVDDKRTESRLTETIIEFLIGLPLFHELSTSELRIVARHMSFIEIKKDDVLFYEGDRGNYMCFVVDGALEVIKQTEQHTEAVISTLTRGRSIGEMSVIDNFPRSATVRATTAATLLVLTRDRFETLLDTHPPLGIKLLKSLARLMSMHLRRTSSQLADFMAPVHSPRNF
ncbi:MAG: cyclic nucleotide-binding domain-containing protein [Desulfobacterota bacterium]|nr:cyclic nucleotide-binding domain-containing protein [Thermodesulfobacteriota bacterium]